MTICVCVCVCASTCVVCIYLSINQPMGSFASHSQQLAKDFQRCLKPIVGNEDNFKASYTVVCLSPHLTTINQLSPAPPPTPTLTHTHCAQLRENEEPTPFSNTASSRHT